MTFNKRILVVLVFLVPLITISWILSWAIASIFTVPQSAVFLLLCVLQIVGWKLWDIFVEKMVLKNTLEEIAKKPFREYLFNLTCQHCTVAQPVIVSDINDITFTCSHCRKDNVSHISIKTFAKTQEIDMADVNQRLDRVSRGII